MHESSISKAITPGRVILIFVHTAQAGITVDLETHIYTLFGAQRRSPLPITRVDRRRRGPPGEKNEELMLDQNKNHVRVTPLTRPRSMAAFNSANIGSGALREYACVLSHRSGI